VPVGIVEAACLTLYINVGIQIESPVNTSVVMDEMEGVVQQLVATATPITLFGVQYRAGTFIALEVADTSGCTGQSGALMAEWTFHEKVIRVSILDMMLCGVMLVGTNGSSSRRVGTKVLSP
jgi:hypothetical protein